VNTYT